MSTSRNRARCHCTFQSGWILLLWTWTLSSAAGNAPPDEAWFPAAPPLAPPQGQVIHVATSEQLLRAVEQEIRPGGTVLIADGIYHLPRYFEIRTRGVTLRSESGKRDAVVLDGAGSRHHELIGVRACAGVTVADLTLRNVRHNALKVNSDADVQRLTVRNCVFHNVWQRGVKGVRAPMTKPENCVVEYCLFYNDRPKAFGDEPHDTPHSFDGNYIAAIDVMDAVGWAIRDNVFIAIQGRTREGRGAIMLWNDSRDCVVERNVVVDCDVGIYLGNASKPDDVVSHCSNFLVRNNFFTRTPEQAIFVGYTTDCRILHNSIEDPANARRRSIRIYGPNEGLTVRNNLISGPAIQASEAEGSRIDIATNAQGEFTRLFVDAGHGNLRLAIDAPDVVDGAVERRDVRDDIDRNRRDSRPDIGAYERVQ